MVVEGKYFFIKRINIKLAYIDKKYSQKISELVITKLNVYTGTKMYSKFS